MEFCAFGVLDAVRRPWSSLVFERYVVWRMPVSSCYDACFCFLEHANIFIKNWNHFVSFGNRQRSCRTEIILQIHNCEYIRFDHADFFLQIKFPLIIVELLVAWDLNGNIVGVKDKGFPDQRLASLHERVIKSLLTLWCWVK